MIPVWTERNLWVRDFIPENSSVIDWGCGKKDILRYYTPKEYLGIDIDPNADIIADFNQEIPKISGKYDVGLALGVLEYLEDYENFLKNISDSANVFLVLFLVDRRKKEEWKNAFTSEFAEEILRKNWKNVKIERDKNYLLGICSN
jgi:2-polyprenyl-3-methyl-5-hydroxy-6-metoxy-1,4-benzoquinol methylase